MSADGAYRVWSVDRIARLPKWAQQYIATLQQDLAYAQRKVAQVGGDAPTDTVMRRGFHETPVPLPAGAIIEFGIGNSRIQARWTGDALHVSGGLPIAIRPNVANVVTIHTEQR